jgi:hypothetical protein
MNEVRVETRRALHDFLILEMLLLARLPLRVSTVRRALVPFAAVAGAALILAGAAAGVLLHVLADSSEGAGTVKASVVAVAAVSCAGFTVRTLLGPGVLAVRRSPQRDLFRAVDAPVVPLFVFVFVTRAIPRFGGWLAFGVGYAAAWAQLSRGDLTQFAPALLLLFVPVICASCHVAGGAVASASTARWLTPVIALVVMVGAGFGGVVGAGGASAGVEWIGAAVALLVWVAALVVRRKVSALSEAPFPIAGEASDASGLRGRSLVRILTLQSVRDVWIRVPRLLVLAAAAALCATAGARLGGFDAAAALSGAMSAIPGADGMAAAWIPSDATSFVRQGAVAVSIATGLVAIEVTNGHLGVARALPRLRFAWEAGRSRSSLVAAQLTVACAVPTMLGVCWGAAAVLLTGDARVVALTVAAALGGAYASVSADCLVAPHRHADGTSSPSAVGSLVMMSALLPTSLTATLSDAEAAMAAPLMTIVTGGVAAWTLARRIRHTWR